MKAILAIVTLWSAGVMAAPPVTNSLTQILPEGKSKYGVTYFRMVMPGVLYRGGNENPKNRVQLSTGTVQNLCSDGFDAVVYAYSDKSLSKAKAVSCGSNSTAYVSKPWNTPSAVRDMLQELRDIIVEGKGAMYVHCWYGTHASGYLATAALMQFCGLSNEEGVAYWNMNVAPAIRYPKEHARIRAFKRYDDLTITPEQQKRVCPSL